VREEWLKGGAVGCLSAFLRAAEVEVYHGGLKETVALMFNLRVEKRMKIVKMECLVITRESTIISYFLC